MVLIKNQENQVNSNGWRIWDSKFLLLLLKRKITNMIIQSIAKQSFYSITNMDIKSTLNTQFAQLYSQFNNTFPFKISALSLTINYPPNSFSVNNTLGIQLLKAKSLLSQLSNQYDTINAYITTNIAKINATYVQNVSFLFYLFLGRLISFNK